MEVYLYQTERSATRHANVEFLIDQRPLPHSSAALRFSLNRASGDVRLGSHPRNEHKMDGNTTQYPRPIKVDCYATFSLTKSQNQHC